MKYHRWDPKTKARIVLESLEGKTPISEICNKYGIRQSVLAYWLKAFEQKGYQVFESSKRSKKEQRLKDENEKLKKIRESNPNCECGSYLEKPVCETCGRDYKKWLCKSCGAVYEIQG